MKGTYVLVVAFLASWTVATATEEQLPEVQPDHPEKQLARIATICPFPKETFPENTTTNLAHENDCSKFYKCFLGKGIPQLCPYMEKGSSARLHYNIFEQVCDWPWRAGCSRCPEEDEDGNWLPPSRIPHESGDCSMYYECANGHKTLRYCPSGTCFSRTCQTCVVNPRGGICDDSGWIPPPTRPPPTRPPPTRPPPTRPPPTRPPPTSPPYCYNGDRTSHHCNCAKYYQCKNNEDWMLQECDGGLHYSPYARECLPPNEANCPTRGIIPF